MKRSIFVSLVSILFCTSLIFAEEEINISIVPKEEQISDTEVKLALAHLLLLNGSKKEEALIILQKLMLVPFKILSLRTFFTQGNERTLRAKKNIGISFIS